MTNNLFDAYVEASGKRRIRIDHIGDRRHDQTGTVVRYAHPSGCVVVKMDTDGLELTFGNIAIKDLPS